MTRRPRRQSGFTLLEVMIALTLTGLVLGGLLSLSAGSKRLAVTAQQTLHDAVQRRAALQYAQLEPVPDRLEPMPGEGPRRFEIRAGDWLPDPIRRTTPTQWLLQEYRLEDTESDEILSGSRWVRSDVPR